MPTNIERLRNMGIWYDDWGGPPENDPFSPSGPSPAQSANPYESQSVTPPDNTFDNLRLSSTMMGPQDPDEDDETFVMRRYNEIYQPSHTYTEQLANLMKNWPQRSVDKPGFWRKMGASLTGLGGGKINREMQDEMLHPQYNERMRDIQNQLQPLEFLSNKEQQDNANLSRMAYQQTGRELQLRRIKNQELVNQQKYDLALAKFEHPNWVFKTGDDGYVYAIDPQNPERIMKTKVKTIQLTFDERQRLGLDMIAAREEATARNIGRQGAQTQANENQRQEHRKELKNIPQATAASAAGAKPVAATQQKVAEYNKARNAKNTHPEWSKYIQLGSPGVNDFTIKRPWGGDDATVKAINDYIYGATAAPTATPKPTPTANPNPQQNALRDKAVALLRSKGKAETEANIGEVIRRLKEAGYK